MVSCDKLIFIVTAVTTCTSQILSESTCGCKRTRACYADMLYELRERDEKTCIDDVEVGTSTYLVYFKALEKYCGDIFNVTTEYTTSELRNLYEVNIFMKTETVRTNTENIPIILIEAGQKAGREPVRVALSVIERLMACEENEYMIQNVRWVFLPSTNPDGFEYVRFDRPNWSKNTRKIGDGASYGIDISRNFDAHWNECEQVKSSLDDRYPGPTAASEIETRFIRNTLLKYKDDIKAYLSVRRDGHGIFYPHAYSDKIDDVDQRQVKAAEMISLKVNQRGASLHAFINDSIYKQNGKAVCGSSIDYAHAQGILLPYEYRVGFETDIQVLKTFQVIHPGFFTTLRGAYFSGIRELYAIVTTKSVM